MKKLILLVLLSVIMFFGCSNLNTRENISKNLIKPESVTLASSLKTRDKPGYEWVNKSTIIFDENNIKEFLRVTHIFDSPEAQSEVDNEAFYMNSEPKAIYQKIGIADNWKKSNREETDEYTTINRIFNSLIDDLKEEKNHDKGEDKTVFSLENTAKELSQKDNYFKSYQADDKVKIEFVVAKKDNKYFIEDTKIEVNRFDLPHIVYKYMVININEVKSIDYSPDLVRLLVRDKVKNYTVKEK